MSIETGGNLRQPLEWRRDIVDEEIDPISFSDFLNAALKRRGISGRALAAFSGIDHSSISYFRNGQPPDLDIAGLLVANSRATQNEVLGLIAYYGKGASSTIGPRVPSSEGSFGEQLSKYLLQRRIGFRALGRVAGVSHSTIYRQSMGQRLPSIAVGCKIITALNLSPEQKINMFMAPYHYSERFQKKSA